MLLRCLGSAYCEPNTEQIVDLRLCKPNVGSRGYSAVECLVQRIQVRVGILDGRRNQSEYGKSERRFCDETEG